jgi:sulfate adenylyltransferase subunit 2
VDTGHNFPETIEFRDRLVKELGLELIVRNVQDADEGKVVEETWEIVCKQLLFLML